LGQFLIEEFNSISLECGQVLESCNQLPNSNIIRSAISKVILVFTDVVQIELLRARWEEIKRYCVKISV